MAISVPSGTFASISRTAASIASSKLIKLLAVGLLVQAVSKSVNISAKHMFFIVLPLY
jgi:hypothetical protein